LRMGIGGDPPKLPWSVVRGGRPNNLAPYWGGENLSQDTPGATHKFAGMAGSVHPRGPSVARIGVGGAGKKAFSGWCVTGNEVPGGGNTGGARTPEEDWATDTAVRLGFPNGGGRPRAGES